MAPQSIDPPQCYGLQARASTGETKLGAVLVMVKIKPPAAMAYGHLDHPCARRTSKWAGRDGETARLSRTEKLCG